MRAFLVVFGGPPMRDLADLVKPSEHVRIGHVVRKDAVEVFDAGVLIRLARLDQLRPRDQHVVHNCCIGSSASHGCD